EHGVVAGGNVRFDGYARRLAAPPAAPQLVEAAAMDDPVEPGGLVARALEAHGQPPVGPEQRLLEDVVDAARIREHPVRDPPQPRLVSLEQRLEPARLRRLLDCAQARVRRVKTGR